MKIARQSKIVELINEYDIETQEELAARLNAAGFKVTQATVSRDIREMKLMKMARQDGGSKYGLVSSPNTADSEKYIRVLRDAYLSMDVRVLVFILAGKTAVQHKCGSSGFGPYQLSGNRRKSCRRRYHSLLLQK